jgi:hypothetical protein
LAEAARSINEGVELLAEARRDATRRLLAKTALPLADVGLFVQPPSRDRRSILGSAPIAGLVERGEYRDAGVDELFVQQIGPERDAFFDTWAREVLPPFA